MPARKHCSWILGETRIHVGYSNRNFYSQRWPTSRTSSLCCVGSDLRRLHWIQHASCSSSCPVFYLYNIYMSCMQSVLTWWCSNRKIWSSTSARCIRFRAHVNPYWDIQPSHPPPCSLSKSYTSSTTYSTPLPNLLPLSHLHLCKIRWIPSQTTNPLVISSSTPISPWTSYILVI